MPINTAAWFYAAPDKSAYLLAERVRNAFWAARLGALWLDAVQTEPPVLTGQAGGTRLRLEWEPARWLRFSTAPAAPGLVEGLAGILRRPPTLRYEDREGNTVWEWWLNGADQRWQEIQGRPTFQNPARLDQDH